MQRLPRAEKSSACFPRHSTAARSPTTGSLRSNSSPPCTSARPASTSLSDAILALPGGFGTLDELIEAITWAQIGLHAKPCILINTAELLERLAGLSRHCGCRRFIEPKNRELVRVAANAPRSARHGCERTPEPTEPRARMRLYHAFMSKKLRFGVLSTANIGLKKVIPAMQQGERTTVTAIASRDLAKAREAADTLGIATAYGSYEELLADPNIDAIYNPLPNQLHVPWTTKAAEAGKHVLCEKPLSMTVAEAKTLLGVRDRTGVKICEAFMIRSAPQWLRLRQLARRRPHRRAARGQRASSATSTSIRRTSATAWRPAAAASTTSAATAFRPRASPLDRNQRAWLRSLDRDPQMGTDRLASAILDFPSGHAIFTCSTQLIPYQRVHFLGTRGPHRARDSFQRAQ